MERGPELPAQKPSAVFAMDVGAFDDFEAAIAAVLARLREQLGRECRWIVRQENGDWTIGGEPGTRYRRADERRFVAADGPPIDAELAVDLVRRDGVRHAAIVVPGGGPPLSAGDRALVETTVRLLTSLVDAERRAAKAEADAKTDPLTGLPNRRGWGRFMNQIEAFRQTADRSDDLRAIVIVVDIEGLKGVNERRGYAAGDELLQQAAAALQNVTSNGTIARIGGDEFVVWFPDSGRWFTESGEIEALITRIRATLDDAAVPAAIGGAIYDGTRSTGEVFAEADARMVADKRRKRGG
jgi:diguanylate cyclase (GGDEF)-like protein